MISCSSTLASSAPATSSTLTAEDIRRSPGQSLEQLLLARVPGLTIERAADGHSKLVIRGKTTIVGDDEVLFVVNDIALGPALIICDGGDKPKELHLYAPLLRHPPSLRLYGYLHERCVTEGIQHVHLSLSHSATCAIAHT